MGGYMGSMGAITRCDHEEALRGVYGGYGVVIWGYRGGLWVQLHGVTMRRRCELSMGVLGWFYGVIGGVYGCNYTV